MQDTTRDLLDRAWDLQVELDDRRPLWDGDVDQLERWPRTSASHTADGRARLHALRDEALAAAAARADDDPDVPSLLTAADAASLLALQLDVAADVSWAHPVTGLHAYLYWAVNDVPLRTVEHGRRYLDKLAGFPATAQEMATRLEQAAAAGRGPISSHALRTAERIEGQLATPVADDPLLRQAAPTELGGPDAERWRDDLAGAVRDHLRPGLAGLATTLRDVVAPAGRADDDCGWLHRPGGGAEYAALVEAFTSPGTTARQLHDTGLAQLQRLEVEYAELGRRAFGVEDAVEVRRRLVDDTSLRFGSAEEVVAAATRLHARAVDAASAWFSRTPRADCVVRGTEHGAIGFYTRPAEDGSRPAVFYLNTADPGIWGANLASTVFHEGVPGHHYQLALAQEDASLHPLHRHAFLPAFGEGWGLYAERLADEIGLYESDLDRLGVLVADSMRACRLVVDTGMHAFGWSRRRAIDFMLANAPMGEGEIAAEVDRYIGWPGQAVSYMTGRLELERLRAEAAARLGDGFDVRRFHDVVLSRGMVSLPALRRMVAAWAGGPVA